MTIILLILVLAILVLSHEFGHFIVAKLSGIKVEEFGLGLPPRIFGRKIGDTIYSINWIPFGGFVRIFGESETPTDGEGKEFNDNSDNKEAFVNKPKLIQAGVIVAGIIFNLLLAFVLIWTGLQAGLPVAVEDFGANNSQVTNHQVIITGIKSSSPAEIANVPEGAYIKNFKTPEELIAYVESHKREEIKLETDRGDFRLTPNPILGIEMSQVGEAHLSVMSAIPAAFRVTTHLTKETIVGLANFVGSIFAGKGFLAGVVGPVGIAEIVRDASNQGFASLLFIMAILSISLAVINLAPFPALDGGRLLFVIIEAIKGSPIRKSLANTVNLVGFSLLIALMVFVTYHDIIKLIRN